jgi:hypothetical protein
MKKILLATIAGIALVTVLAVNFPKIKNSVSSKAESKTTSGLTVCDGEYALCAASTCKPVLNKDGTPKMITGNNGVAYPEVECRCPILKGRAIADTKAGNMAGSCTPTDSQHVWSLFAPKIYYPQEASDFSNNPKDMKATIQKCDASLNLGAKSSNCFSWNCKIGANGIAICSCPAGQVPPATTFLTEAGQGNPEACGQYPVSLPIQNPPGN